MKQNSTLFLVLKTLSVVTVCFWLNQSSWTQAQESNPNHSSRDEQILRANPNLTFTEGDPDGTELFYASPNSGSCGFTMSTSAWDALQNGQSVTSDSDHPMMTPIACPRAEISLSSDHQSVLIRASFIPHGCFSRFSETPAQFQIAQVHTTLSSNPGTSPIVTRLQIPNSGPSTCIGLTARTVEFRIPRSQNMVVIRQSETLYALMTWLYDSSCTPAAVSTTSGTATGARACHPITNFRVTRELTADQLIQRLTQGQSTAPSTPVVQPPQSTNPTLGQSAPSEGSSETQPTPIDSAIPTPHLPATAMPQSTAISSEPPRSICETNPQQESTAAALASESLQNPNIREQLMALINEAKEDSIQRNRFMPGTDSGFHDLRFGFNCQGEIQSLVSIARSDGRATRFGIINRLADHINRLIIQRLRLRHPQDSALTVRFSEGTVSVNRLNF